MKTIKGVKSSTKPIEVDDYSSNTTVFVRNNIEEKLEIDPVFYNEVVVYTYDETQYTHAEWNKIKTDSMVSSNQNMQQELDVMQLAIIEILNIIGGLIPATTSLDDDPKNHHSAISAMLGMMIIKHLITIEQVPEFLKGEVETYIDDKNGE